VAMILREARYTLRRLGLLNNRHNHRQVSRQYYHKCE
jgi:hypothetical protein